MPVNVKCPACHSTIPLEDINVSTDIALCRQCSKTYSFAELCEDQASLDVDISRPPRGAWFNHQGMDSVAGATTRAWGALFLVPFAAVWSGGSLGGLYGSQIIKGKFELLPSLFGIPFLLGSCLLVTLASMSACGKVVVRRSGDDGSIFQGVGPFGWTRRFRWSDIKAVRVGSKKWKQNGRNDSFIELEATKPIRFGSLLSETRRDFIVAVLKRQMWGRG